HDRFVLRDLSRHRRGDLRARPGPAFLERRRRSVTAGDDEYESNDVAPRDHGVRWYCRARFRDRFRSLALGHTGKTATSAAAQGLLHELLMNLTSLFGNEV